MLFLSTKNIKCKDDSSDEELEEAPVSFTTGPVFEDSLGRLTLGWCQILKVNFLELQTLNHP